MYLLYKLNTNLSIVIYIFWHYNRFLYTIDCSSLTKRLFHLVWFFTDIKLNVNSYLIIQAQAIFIFYSSCSNIALWFKPVWFFTDLKWSLSLCGMWMWGWSRRSSQRRNWSRIVRRWCRVRLSQPVKAWAQTRARLTLFLRSCFTTLGYGRRGCCRVGQVRARIVVVGCYIS